MDTFNRKKRSQIMASVKSKNTKPEMTVRKLLFSMGYRYKLHNSKLPGSPDIVLPKYRSVIFVHGCFWHYHEGCSRSKYPSTNREFWISKINSNVERDAQNIIDLKSSGWKVLVLWGCEVGKEDLRDRLQSFLPK